MIKLVARLKRMRSVVVDCYTADPQVFAYARIERAGKFLPDWWKQLPADSDKPNMRNCYGLLAQHAKSFVLPLWSDLDVELGRDGYSWRFSDKKSNIEVHGGGQYVGWADAAQGAHLKLDAPWRFRCEEEIHFQWSDASWSKETLFDYVSPSAVVEYKYQAATGVNLLFNTSVRPKVVRLKHGQPLVYITPLTDRPVEFRCHLVSREAFNAVAPVFPAMTKKSYQTYKAIAKQEEAARCPFHNLLGK
jgi:hypothetical protein